MFFGAADLPEIHPRGTGGEERESIASHTLQGDTF